VNDGRIESLEADLRPEDDGVQYITFLIQEVETFYDANSERCERNIPAKYDESVAFTTSGRMRTRVLYPAEQTADHGILRDREVTGD
jgi:hypothetical protein